MSKDEDYGYQQARAQMESVAEMVRALECDYDRLEELREELADLKETVKDTREDVENFVPGEQFDRHGNTLNELRTSNEEAEKALADWQEENAEELRDLEDEAGDCENEEEARERIQEDALSVEVRSGWTSAGETMQPEEYRIVLCTGGPHVEIRGDLDRYNQPSSATLHYSDWGTSGDYFGDNLDENALLTYARQFYFGE